MKRYLTATVSLFLLLAGLAGGAHAAQGWEMLGRQEVDFKNDHDRIDVGRKEGRFKQLEIRVEGVRSEPWLMRALRRLRLVLLKRNKDKREGSGQDRSSLTAPEPKPCTNWIVLVF